MKKIGKNTEDLSIVVIGASGDLAGKKIFPALFSLYCQGLLPENFSIFGFARSELSHSAFREKIILNLTCRYTPDHSCATRIKEFLARCFYCTGTYGNADSFLDLYQLMRDKEKEARGEPNRMFYMAIPPSVFVDTARALGSSGLVQCDLENPWTRVVVEKPFGRDGKSSDELNKHLTKVFAEKQIFRIDHYLGKEVIQNLLVLRFANLIFEPLWNNKYIEKIKISWKEDIGTDGRGGYFDQYGIIRDVMQNHIVQILALVAMEPPIQLDSSHISKEKVKLLRHVTPVKVSDMVIGQYTGRVKNGKKVPSYRDDKTVPDKSITPTYASAVLEINNRRWKGVPFEIIAGKALDDKMTEIRITFRETSGCIFCNGPCHAANEMIIRVQPDESIILRITNKIPGMNMELASCDLDLSYDKAFDVVIPDAYESLLLDVIRGDKSLFISNTELRAAWNIFSPVLHEIEKRKLKPVAYKFGSTGPVSK